MTTFEGPPLDRGEGVGALTLGGFLAEVAGRFGPNEALVSDEARWTYADLDRGATRIAAGLVAAGVKPGEGVGILMGNRPEAVAAIFGAARAGAVAVLLSTFAPRPELAYMLERAEVTVALTQARVASRRPGDDLTALAPGRVAVLGTSSWDDLLAAGAAPLPEVDPEDDALVIFSSGTTDRPKAMLHCHRAPTRQFWVQAQIFGR
ncbi:MAG TPA: AMP-binding protein, partial [Acidimicrobiales bacterium]|nr:AMP-binding protein [Acidimicrobiales bacterium]